MKVVVLTAWGDEHLLAPYFCRHYAFANEIIVLMGPGMHQPTIDACRPFPNVVFHEVQYPGGQWDMYVKQHALTKMAYQVEADWIIMVDADEFLFPMAGIEVLHDPRWFLQNVDGNVVLAAMWHVYRHVTDRDLDPGAVTVFQRRHGDPEIEHHYIKPIVVKPHESQIKWHIGAHRYFENEHIRVAGHRFAGVHWHWADVDIAIARHRMTTERIIPAQRWLTDAVDENMIRLRCEAHRNDPRLF